MKNWKKYLAEFIGTFVLVLFACGVAGQTCGAANEGCGYLVTALAFGLVIVAMAYSIGNVSGCHINPAVSIAMLLNKKMSIKDFIGYIIAQFLGAFAGAAVLYAVVGDAAKLGTNALYNGDWAMSFIIEVLLTFVFVIAIIGVTSKKEYGSVAGLVIGGALVLVHLLGISFTGTSVNPARSFGPALMALIAGQKDAFCCIWVFILAPLVGGVLAALVYALINNQKEELK
ncbi:MAG: aquaporin [Clostridiales bacterium]|nr:aquaporin [Clostridiales bacterium]